VTSGQLTQPDRTTQPNYVTSPICGYTFNRGEEEKAEKVLCRASRQRDGTGTNRSAWDGAGRPRPEEEKELLRETQAYAGADAAGR
jgi:hypothetical protein